MWETTRRKSLDVNLIPLINVVFLLLIFFLVAGVFVKPTSSELSLPQSNGGEETLAEYTLTIEKDSSLLWQSSPIAFTNLRLHLLQTLDKDKLNTVTIHADAATDSHYLLAVMKQIKLAGIDTITLSSVQVGE